MKRKFSIISYVSFLIGLEKLKRNGTINVSQNIETPAADLIFYPSSILILPLSVLSSPHKEPISRNTPPNIPYSSCIPIVNDASKLRAVNILPPKGTLSYEVSTGPIPWFLKPLRLSPPRKNLFEISASVPIIIPDDMLDDKIISSLNNVRYILKSISDLEKFTSPPNPLSSCVILKSNPAVGLTTVSYTHLTLPTKA